MIYSESKFAFLWTGASQRYHNQTILLRFIGVFYYKLQKETLK